LHSDVVVTSPEATGELGKRAIVVVVALPLVAVAIGLGARPSAALFGAAAAIACWEYYRLVFGSIPAVAWVGVAFAAVLPIVPAAGVSDVGSAVLAIVATTSMLAWVVHLFWGPRATAPERVGHIVAGLLFCSLGPLALAALRAGADGSAWAVLVLVASWANDAAAYAVGSALGRNKLCPEVSPRKTWEGLLGGLCGGVLALLLLRPWLPRYLSADACVLLGVLVGVLGSLGDLSKSMLKRAYHAKDASHLFPGHGGMLDRIDSILFAAPVVWLVRITLFPR
jgi:phosphatidate cytidylyltransferase